MKPNEQIAEMAKILCKQYSLDECDICIGCPDCIAEDEAKALYTAGYRKASEVAREIFAEIERTCIDSFGCFYLGATRGPFAELKKKYLEGEV